MKAMMLAVLVAVCSGCAVNVVTVNVKDATLGYTDAATSVAVQESNVEAK
jgi:hypothetical protein